MWPYDKRCGRMTNDVARGFSPAGRVQLFHTCLVNEVAPDVARAAVRVLDRLGFDVEVPADQTCCGQPAFNAGFHADARQVARHTIGVLERTTGPIVIPSGSCADMIVHQYERLFEEDAAMAARARAVSARCREFSQYIADCGLRIADSKSAIQNQSAIPNPQSTMKVAYHPSCHLLRGLGVDRQP